MLNIEYPNIPGYRDLKTIGEGGMGSVFSAFRESDGRKVAIKVIRSDIDDSTSSVYYQRFKREIEVSKHFAHPYLVKILDGGSLKDSTLFLVMEHLSGQSLEERASVSPLTADEFIKMAAHLCEAMSAYSQQGLIHRDIKPSNIFLTDEGRTVLLDFGLVLASDHTALTETGDRLGTFCAMAPEQLLGHEIDIRADIYGLGVSLYMAVTQQRPRSHDDIVRLATGSIIDEPKEPHLMQKGFPKALSHIIMRCLELRAEDRFQTVKQLADALRAATDSTNAQTEDLAITLKTKPVGSENEYPPIKHKHSQHQRLKWIAFVFFFFVAILFVLGEKDRGDRQYTESHQSMTKDVAILQADLLRANTVPTIEDCKTLGTLLAKIGVSDRLKLKGEATEEALALLYLARSADRPHHLYLAFLDRHADLVFAKENEQLRHELSRCALDEQYHKELYFLAREKLASLDEPAEDYCRYFLARMLYLQFIKAHGVDSSVPPTSDLRYAKQALSPLFGGKGKWLHLHDKALLYLNILACFSSKEGKEDSQKALQRFVMAKKTSAETATLYLHTALNMLRRPISGEKLGKEFRLRAIEYLKFGLSLPSKPQQRFDIQKLLADNLIRVDELKEAAAVIASIKLTRVPKSEHWSLYELKAELAEAKKLEGEAIDLLKTALDLTKDKTIRVRLKKKRDRIRLRYYSAGGGGS